MSTITISRAPRESPHLDAVLEFDSSRSELQLQISAKRKLRVCELQGSRRVLEAFGARQPAGFSTRWFGDEADVPNEMLEDVAFTNRVEFRWGCDIGVTAGNSAQVVLPAKGFIDPTAAHGIWSVVYEYRKFFGLVREKLSFTLAIDAREQRGMTPNKSLQADRDASGPHRARSRLRARRCAVASWPAAELGR